MRASHFTVFISLVHPEFSQDINLPDPFQTALFDITLLLRQQRTATGSSQQ